MAQQRQRRKSTEKMQRKRDRQPDHVEAVAEEPAFFKDTPIHNIMQMQRLSGNAAVMRMMETGNFVQRAPAGAGNAAAVEQAERELAQHILSEIEARGGLNVAVYLTAIEDPANDAEFERQASQYAKDHLSIGVSGGKLKKGVAMGIDQPVKDKVQSVVTEVDTLLTKFPDLYTEKPAINVETLSVFTHGAKKKLKASPTGGWIDASTFSDGLAQYLTSSPTMNVYACNTAGSVTSGKNFATDLHDQLNEDLKEEYGDEADASVWGHTNAAHTTYNTNLVGVGAGGAFKPELGKRVLEMVLSELSDGDLTSQQRTTLTASAEKVIEKTFSEVKKADDPEYKTKYSVYTLAKDVQQVYFREITLLGMDRVWEDLTAESDPSDYDALGMTGEANERMKQGAKFFRERFQKQLTAFRTQAMTLTGKQLKPKTEAPAPENVPAPAPNAANPAQAEESGGWFDWLPSWEDVKDWMPDWFSEDEAPVNAPAPAPKNTPPAAPPPPAASPANAPVPTGVTLSAAEVQEAIKYNKGRNFSRTQIEKIQETVGAEPDGVIGKDTVKRIAQWQSQNGLTPDGKVGPRTQAQIIPPSNDNSNQPAPTPAPSPAPAPAPSNQTQPGENNSTAGSVDNWLNVLPTMSRTAQQKIEVTLQSTKEAPQVSNASVGPSGELNDQQQQIVDAIKQNRGTLDVSKLKLVRYAGKYGYVYGGNTETDATPSSLQGDAEGDQRKQAEQWIWEEMRHEGGTSSINAYDSQMVTWGRGLGAKSGPMQTAVMKELFQDAEVAAEFMKFGVYYDTQLRVVNLETGAIESGQNALALMQADPQLLSVLIAISENPAFHQKVTDAQWEGTKKHGTARVPDYALEWDKECIQLVAHITHWGPAYGWHNTDYKDTDGDILQIMLTFIKKAAGGANSNGSYSILKGNNGNDLTKNLDKWGSGVGLKALNDNFSFKYLTEDDVYQNEDYDGKYIVRDGRKGKQNDKWPVYVY